MAAYRRKWPFGASPPVYMSPPAHVSPLAHVSPCAVVKVENLAKTTKEEDLVKRLEEFNFLSVKVIQCPNALVNYAYLNCTDSTTAQTVVDKVNGRMLIHNNMLKAKIKAQGRHAGPFSSSYVQPMQPKPKPKDICAVKVLVQDFILRGTDLDDHFRQFGELTSPTIVRPGNPNFAYINFENPSAAQQARGNSQYTINGKTVVVVPFKTSQNPQVTNPTQDLVSLEFPCDRLATETAKRELLQVFKDKPMMKIVTKETKFIVHIQGGMGDVVKKQIPEIIKSHESNLEIQIFNLEFHYLPLLADKEVQKKIFEIQLPFEVKILRGTEKMDLDHLATEFPLQGIRESDIHSYLMLPSPAVATSVTQYCWYWFDDITFQPYIESISMRLERKFNHKTKFEQSIGKYTYIIDTVKMTQTNKSTYKERKIERRPTTSNSVNQHVITLAIRANKDHNPELQRAIKEILSNVIYEEQVLLTNPVTETGTLTNQLLEKAKMNFVKATFKEDGIAVITLQGKEILVKSTEVEIQSEILKKERDIERSSKVTVPAHWDPQDKKCELKPVSRHSAEWKEVQDKMHRSGFTPSITKIERIQNTWLWESYQVSTKRMSEKNAGTVNEKMLFHGTKRTPPKDIYDSEQGFDHRLASKGLWGEGTYFAVEPNYSDRYAYTLSTGSKQVFLAKVITGISCSYTTEDRALKAPPKKSEHKSRNSRISIAAKFEGERYDSVTAHTNNSQVFVIYELGRVYPAYLITYSNSTDLF